MPKDMRSLVIIIGLIVMTGCTLPPRGRLRQTQLAALKAHNQALMLSGELQQANDSLMYLTNEKSMLEGHASQLEQNLSIANERLSNLAQERSRLHDEYRDLLTSFPNGGQGLANRRFEELARKYPQFEFDPITGVSRYNVEIIFESGSNQLSPESHRALQEFASIMNEGDARQFNVLVVGHTDDEAVVRPETRALHETNWELSAHRATAVVRQLAKNGVSEPRMGVAGYNKFQPAVPNSNASNKSRNRRVELFVLAPDASIAGKELSHQ